MAAVSDYTLYRNGDYVRIVLNYAEPDEKGVRASIFEPSMDDLQSLARDLTVAARVPIWRRVLWGYRTSVRQTPA